MGIRVDIKLVIMFVAFLDILGIGILIPMLPLLQKVYGVSDQLISLGIVLFSFFSFFSAPILGQLSDIYGRKKILLICLVGSLFGWGVIAFSSSFIFYLISRILTGITGGNISIIRTMFTDISKDSKENKINMGMIMMIFGLGFIIGPFVGGILSQYGIKVPFYFSMAASVISIVLAIFMEETNKDPKHSKINFNPIKSIYKYAFVDKINIFLLGLFLLFTSIQVYNTILSLYLSKYYGYTTHLIAYILSFIGVVSMVNQGVFMKKFWLKYFSVHKLVYIVNIGFTLSYFLLSTISNSYIFLILIFLNVILMGVLNSVYQGEISDLVPAHKRGEMSGIVTSVMGLGLIFGPLIGGYLIDNDMNLFFVSFILSLLSSIAVFLKYEEDGY